MIRTPRDSASELNRRSFCRLGATCSAGLAFAAVKAVAGRETVSGSASPDYIDVHTHLGKVWSNGAPLTAADLLHWMDAHGTAQAVVLPLVSPESSSYPITTDFVLAETAPYGDRLIPFCSVDPRTSYGGGRPGLVEMLKAYVDQGARGFGEHKPGVAIDDPGNMELYAACTELALPILFHIDNLRNFDTPGLPGLTRVLETYPETVFIGHGPGWWASISGAVSQADLNGYPRGDVAPGGAIDLLMDRFPNLYGDLSAGSGAGALDRDRGFAADFLRRRSDRLFFGTDYLAPGQDVPQFELLAGLEMSDEARAGVYRENARRVLGMA